MTPTQHPGTAGQPTIATTCTDAELDAAVRYDSTNRKPYPKNKNYLVGKDGTVWATRFRNGTCEKPLDVPRKMKTRLRPIYPAVGLFKDGARRDESVHVMVLETFVGQRPDGFQAAHLDGNPLNARLENLAWVSCLTNNRHKYAHGTIPYGTKTTSAKLTERAVLEIRAMNLSTINKTHVAARYGVHRKTISRVLSGERWKHLLRAHGAEVTE